MKKHNNFFLLFPIDHYGKKGRKTTLGKRKGKNNIKVQINIKRKQQKIKFMIFLLELLIKRCNSMYGRTRLVGKQSDASFFFW